MENSVIARLDRTAAAYPEKIIFKDSASSLTFSEFDRLTRSVGSFLCARTCPEAPVAVMSGRHCLTPAYFLGIARAGCFYAPVDGDMPADRLNKTLAVVNAPIMLVDNAHLEKARSLDFGGEIIVAEDILDTPIDENKLREREKLINAMSPLYVIFTSGSTGTPKGVITSHLSLMTYIDSVAKALGITDGDILGNQSPLDYIAAIRDIYLPIEGLKALIDANDELRLISDKIVTRLLDLTIDAHNKALKRKEEGAADEYNSIGPRCAKVIGGIVRQNLSAPVLERLDKNRKIMSSNVSNNTSSVPQPTREKVQSQAKTQSSE